MITQLAKHPTVYAICHASGVSEVLEAMYDFCLDQGGDKMSYHFTPVFETPTSPNTKVFAKGFSGNWMAVYGERAVRNADPVPSTVMQQGAVMTWGEVRQDSELSDEEKCFIDLAQTHGLKHGVGVPLWGPGSRNAYAAVGFEKPALIDDDCAYVALQMMLQAGHQRICELIPADSKRPRLSSREKEILSWAAKGKSNTVIAEILDISPDTVATYMRRAFDKLGSRDRVGATIRALKLGLIALDE